MVLLGVIGDDIIQVRDVFQLTAVPVDRRVNERRLI